LQVHRPHQPPKRLAPNFPSRSAQLRAGAHARVRTSTVASVVTPAATTGGGAAAAVDAASERTADMTAVGSPELVAVASEADSALALTWKLDAGGDTCAASGPCAACCAAKHGAGHAQHSLQAA